MKDNSVVMQDEYTLVSKMPQVREVFLGRNELLQKIEEHFKASKRVLL